MPIASFLPAALARFFAPLAGALALSSAAHATIVNESGDAGQTQATAQSTLGVAGSITDIFGSLSSSRADADLYLINITSPSTFSASTVNATGGSLDTELFLLTLAGAPVYFNDDAAGGLSTLSTLPAGSAFGPLAAGTYLIGVSGSGYDPVNAANQLLFGNILLPTVVYGPASGLQPAVLGGFYDNSFGPSSGAYDIQLTGVGTAVAAAVPEPSTNALLLAGGGLCAWAASRRRASVARAGAARASAIAA